MQSFIEDLLSLQLAGEGILTIAKEKFNPLVSIQFVFDMFILKTQNSRVQLVLEFYDDLCDPSDSEAVLNSNWRENDLNQPRA